MIQQTKHPELDHLCHKMTDLVENQSSPPTLQWLQDYEEVMGQIRTYMIENGVTEFKPTRIESRITYQ